jgi:hypothetical protein
MRVLVSIAVDTVITFVGLILISERANNFRSIEDALYF